MERFIEGRSPRTQAAYGRDLELFGAYLTTLAIGPAQVQRYHLLAYRDHLDQRGDAPATVDRRLSVARRFVNACGADVAVPVRSEAPVPPSATVGLVDVAGMIAAITDPARVVEGVAALLLVAKIATVDGIVSMPRAAMGRSGDLNIDGDDVAMPAFMRPALRELANQASDDRLFAGVTRQTLTRRVRSLAEAAGLESVTPRVLARSHERVTHEAAAAQSVAPPGARSDRLMLIADAVRAHLTAT